MKPDAAAIRAFVESLPNRPEIQGTSRAIWPKYLFRIDDVRAAASVLNGGRIYSRNSALQHNVLNHDAAAPAVIGNSPEWIKNYVRLYFRPRTPTEFHSEGFRPQAMLSMGAHRPMPIVLALESIPILVSDGTRFTAGNAASPSAPWGESADFLKSIPFDRVYHAGALKETEKQDTTFRRCAEVLVPGELGLQHLRAVLCRTQAEHETLLDLLTEEAKNTFASAIGVSDKVHYKKWTFVESVAMTQESVTIRFYPWSQAPGPFLARAEFTNLDTNTARGFWQQADFRASGTQSIDIRPLNLTRYRVQLTLDGLLAYSGKFDATETLL